MSLMNCSRNYSRNNCYLFHCSPPLKGGTGEQSKREHTPLILSPEFILSKTLKLRFSLINHRGINQNMRIYANKLIRGIKNAMINFEGGTCSV